MEALESRLKSGRNYISKGIETIHSNENKFLSRPKNDCNETKT